MGAQILDGKVAVLWGPATQEVNWIHLSPMNGRVSVARAHEGGFWVRDIPGVPDVPGIAEKAHLAWRLIREGQVLHTWATHRLAPPHMQIIEPLESETLL